MKLFYFCIILQVSSLKWDLLRSNRTLVVDPRNGGSKINPGIKARITEKGLRYANERAGKILNDEIRKVRIPDLPASFKNGRVEASDIRITHFGAPNYNYDLRRPARISWSLNGGSITVKANWKGKYKMGLIKIRGSGSVSASARNIAMSVSGSMLKTRSGKPQFEAVGCTMDIASLSLKIKGGIVGWLLNIFKGLIAKKLKPVLEDSLCKLAKEFVSQDVNRKLTTLPTYIRLEKIFKVDYRLIENPAVSSNFVEANHKGEITHISSNSTPFYPHPLRTSNSSSKMLYLWASDSVLNSLFHHAHQNDVSKYVITETSPWEYAKHLRLSCSPSEVCFGTLFPEFQSTYPNSKAEILVKTTSDPIIQFIDDKAVFTCQGFLEVYVKKEKDARLILLKAGLSATADFRAKVTNTTNNFPKIHGEIEIESLTVTSIEGDYGYQIGEKYVQMIVNYSKPLVQEQVNKFLAKGLPVLITQGAHVRNLRLKFLPRTLELGADIMYNG